MTPVTLFCLATAGGRIQDDPLIKRGTEDVGIRPARGRSATATEGTDAQPNHRTTARGGVPGGASADTYQVIVEIDKSMIDAIVRAYG